MSGPRVVPPSGTAGQGQSFRRRPQGIAVTERQWQEQVVELAKMLRWAVYHPLLSKWSEPGWPDLALCRPPRLILAELKSDAGKVTPAQRRWLDLLEACPGVETRVWRPSDLDAVAKVLR